MSIADAFDQYYNENDTDVNFSVREAGRLLEFIRNDEHPDDAVWETYDIPKGFVTFDALMRRYSKWGKRTVDFQLKVDGDLKVHYRYSPDEIVLPMLINHTKPDDYLVLDSAILFRKGPAKKLLRKAEEQLVKMINDGFKQVISV